MVIQWHRRVGTGIKMRLSFFSPQSKSHALRDLALRFQFHIHIWSYPQATSATVIVFTLSPNTHTHAHSNFFDAKAKTITMFMLMMVSTMVKGKDLSHKHQINSIIKIIVIIWNKNENHLEEPLYSNVLYCMIWKPNSMMENSNVVGASVGQQIQNKTQF